jgi:hypothetical protein
MAPETLQSVSTIAASLAALAAIFSGWISEFSARSEDSRRAEGRRTDRIRNSDSSGLA